MGITTLVKVSVLAVVIANVVGITHYKSVVDDMQRKCAAAENAVAMNRTSQEIVQEFMWSSAYQQDAVLGQVKNDLDEMARRHRLSTGVDCDLAMNEVGGMIPSGN
jgi:hypothetical protein